MDLAFDKENYCSLKLDLNSFGYKSSFWTQFKRHFDWLGTLDIFVKE